MPALLLRASFFRKLDRFSWSPEHLTVVVGPNGAGKTTILHLLRFLQGTFTRGVDIGLRAAGGGDHVPSRGIDTSELVTFEVCADDVRWVLRLPMSAAGLKGPYGEELYRGDELVLQAKPYEESWRLGNQTLPRDETRCCAKVLWDQVLWDPGASAWLAPLANALASIRTYDEFWFHNVREGTTREDANAFLHGTGKNLWAVLANWKQAPLRFRGQFEWVIRHARLAFPDLLGTIEFEDHEARIFPPGASDPADGLPPRRQPDGLLTGLLQLTAVAGAKPGSIVALDEVENQLHPHAIRTILAAFRELAEERDLTLIITTHSPVVLDAFRDAPERVAVLDPSAPEQPVALTTLKNPEWLSMFSLGDLYASERYGAPTSARRDRATEAVRDPAGGA